jgi:O-glycosyl hydrolase
MPGSARSAVPKVFPILAGTALLTAALVSVARPALAASSATINGGQTFQTITGFGASEGFGQAETIMGASSAVETQALNDLFSPTSGAGLTILRNEISADAGDTIEPSAPSSPTATPTYLPMSQIGNDQDQLTMAQAIKANYGVTNVFADAWSAPAFMKTNNSAINGGTLCGVSGTSCASGNWEQAYANYLKQYAADYSAAGVPLTYVGPENEANLSPSYDGMVMSPSQTAQFLDVLGPTMASSGLSTQVECCATEGWDFAQQYAAGIEADPTALANTAVFTSHGYTQAPTTPLSGWTKNVWETEWSTFEGWDPAWDDNTAASGLTWAQHIFAGLDQSNLNAFLYWWGSSTPSGNGDNESLIQINGSTVSPSGRLWAMAGWSDYVRPGAVRIGATTTDGNLTLDAFKNTNGTIAVVALNTGSSSDTVNFGLTGTGVANGATVKSWLTNSSNSNALQASTTVSSGAFSSTLPARSLVTFTMPSGTTGNTVTVTNPGAQNTRLGTAASLQIQASDSAAGQTLSYSAASLPTGLSINSSTGLISGTPTADGTFAVTVTVTDTTGASGTATFTWTINSGTGNTITINNPGNQTGMVGVPITPVQLHATDSSSTATLTWTATGLPAGLSMSTSGSSATISGTPTAAGTSSSSVSVGDGTGATASVAFTWTISPASTGGSCKVVYTNNSQWPGGFTAQVVITNTGTSAISSWSLAFTFPGDSKITSNFNGGFSQSGANATLTNASYNGSIAPGASVTDGFQGTWTSSNAAPTSFTLNGATCTT